MKETPIKTRQKGRHTAAWNAHVEGVAADFLAALKPGEGQSLRALMRAINMSPVPAYVEVAGAAMQLLKTRGQAIYVKRDAWYENPPGDASSLLQAQKAGWRRVVERAAPPDENPLRAPLLELARRAHRVVDEDPEADDWDSLSAATAAAFAALGEAQPGSEDA
jgi:hypothetical protein